MAKARNWKWLAVLVPLALILLFAAYEGLVVWWYHGYSRGSRTGVVRKISVKGPPFCKYLAGEMALQGANPMQNEIWEFSVDDLSDTNPVVIALHEAEKKGERVTLDYRQDLHPFFQCTPSEYFIVKVEK